MFQKLLNRIIFDWVIQEITDGRRFLECIFHIKQQTVQTAERTAAECLVNKHTDLVVLISDAFLLRLTLTAILQISVVFPLAAELATCFQ